MTPVFGVNIDNRKNKDDSSARFCTARTDEALFAEYEAASDAAFDERQKGYDRRFSAMRNAKTERAMTLCAVICAVLTVVLFFVDTKGAIEPDDRFVSLVPIVYLVIYAAYMIVTRVILKKETPAATSESGRSAESAGGDDPGDPASLFDLNDDPRVHDAAERIYGAFGVPEDAATVDLLAFEYKIEDGEPLIKKSGRRVEFLNLDMKIFKTEDSLCIADLDCRYDFPLNGIRGIRTVRGEFSLILWNKEIPCDRGEYRLYGMKEDRDTNVIFGSYHVLEIECDGEVYGLYFPCYELPALRALGVVAN